MHHRSAGSQGAGPLGNSGLRGQDGRDGRGSRGGRAGLSLESSLHQAEGWALFLISDGHYRSFQVA